MAGSTRRLPVALLIFIPIALVFGAGCSSVGPTVTSGNSELDSLRQENEFLWARLDMVSDSLAFLRSVDTGGYERLARRKDETIAELVYRLQVCGDGGINVAEELVDDLFEPASARLTSAGFDRLNNLIPVLNDPRFSELRVEGHSDSSLPGPTIQNQYPTNWELAAARASAIARHFIDAYGMDPSKITVVSRGATEPKYDNRTSEGRRHNRRIEFVVLYGPEIE